MSIRPRRDAREKAANDTVAFDPNLLRAELDLMRTNSVSESAEASVALGVGETEQQSVGVLAQVMRDFDGLTPTEQQAASLGVHPEAFRPLKELNAQHFEALRMANALSPQLEANIKAFQNVAGASVA